MARPLDIGPPALRFEGSVPYSEAHADIYYSPRDGLAETRYVFLAGNGLPERWQGRNHFVIGETGFGTGLNFLATWQAWRTTAPANARLDYLSAERFPLDRAQIARALAPFTELAALTDELLAHYPPLIPGFHCLHLDGGRVRLTLLFGDASEAFARLEGRVDAWYLDGFAPSRNEAMWTSALFAQIARHSAAGATLATFTAASRVRHALEDARFTVTKLPGFADKREMITARIEAPSRPPSATPWFDPPPTVTQTGERAIIIGGGIAGCSLAHALTGRGLDVTLVEREADVALAASGNPAGLLMPKLTADQSLSSRYYTEAYRYTLDLLARLEADGHRPRWAPAGVLQLGFHETVRRSHARVSARGLPAEFARVVDTEEASELAGAPLPQGGLWFSQGGWIDPRGFCQTLLAACPDERLHVIRNREAVTLARQDGQRVVNDARGNTLARARHVIVCSGADTTRLLPDIAAELTTVRGQITQLPATDTTAMLRCVLCYKGYVTPALEGAHVVGATYDRADLALDLRAADHADNLEKLHRVLPDWWKNVDTDSLPGRAALRSTTPDRLPLAGAVPDAERLHQDYGDLWKGRKPDRYPPVTYADGLYVSAGHSSRGLIGAPLAAELIAAQIMGEPLPLERELLDAIHPGRFIIRRLRRRPADR
ncbi:MAG TPA: bifunctional tRNA (5-methylaminomethyl-2-thiouridine)(34)-methyltransferase MnmD/FAD-dependent 5-carboxymethylaminomethyl-2-thiouridine(34) oxidoreductase MnmC [Thioalkalivibrio sp.]|mgnify:CR=1 FL=1|nr:bifunctional tRNA (5-methylaminomethyl-2-thiouridine)(34)-methyltransferase MnmD/FAD-dependent 5-carboxymethylaminomethyl-2-thiouridine(34) oxidoreductase MnmC [Thioalkalivibrio sp.]